MIALEIDLDRKCSECGFAGISPSGLCLRCTTKRIRSEYKKLRAERTPKKNFNFTSKKFNNERQEELF